MVAKKWSDLKLADEKELRRKKRELARLEKEKKLKEKRRKELLKVYSFVGIIVVLIVAFVFWIYSSWKKKQEEEFKKNLMVKVDKFKGEAWLYILDGKEVPVKAGLKGLFSKARTGKGTYLFLSLGGGYNFYLKENTVLKWKVVDVTSLGKFKVDVELLQGKGYVKCTDLSVFRLKVKNIVLENEKNSKFHLQSEILPNGNVMFLSEYGALKIKLPSGKVKKFGPLRRIEVFPDGKVKEKSSYNFPY